MACLSQIGSRAEHPLLQRMLDLAYNLEGPRVFDLDVNDSFRRKIKGVRLNLTIPLLKQAYLSP